jgi:hypothetical protein
MKTPATEREQALRWLIANRRPDISIEQAVRVMCMALPRDLTTLQILRRIAEEEEAKQPSSHSTGAHFLVCCLADSRLAGEVLPPAHDHIHVLRIEFDQPRDAT